MKNYSSHHTARHKQGFASILTVTSVGIALLIVMISMYENTVESQKAEANHMLRGDYQQREEAFLKSNDEHHTKQSHNWYERQFVENGVRGAI